MAVPSLRFKEFDEGWTENRIKELFEIKAGGDVSKENVSNEKDAKFKYPIYANSEKNFGLYGYSDQFKIDYDSS